jgi:ribosomal protein S18 acetylase RimI-like enzyme
MMRQDPAFAFDGAVEDASAGQLAIGPVKRSDLWQVRNLQRRAFRRGLAYSFTTLVLLWLLPSVRFLVARQGERVVGCAIGDRNAGNSRVINLAVDPGARRRGIGAQLLRTLEAALPEGDVILMVEQGNESAKRLYERTGYISVGVGRNYYGHGHDGIWMRKFRPGGAG